MNKELVAMIVELIELYKAIGLVDEFSEIHNKLSIEIETQKKLIKEKYESLNSSANKDISELESELIQEGLILLLERYKNIIKINNVTNELSLVEKQGIENKIKTVNNLLLSL